MQENTKYKIYIYIVVYVININKDSFSYTIRICDNGQYTPWTNDKFNWIAIAVEP